MKKTFTYFILPILLPLFVYILWQYITGKQIIASYLIPAPQMVFSSFWILFEDGTILDDTWASLRRMLQGYVWAIIAGLFFGVIMGLSIYMEKTFSTIFNAIRVIPPLAWIPLIILWFGIGELSKVVIIFKSAFFPILLNTIQGIEGVPKGYLEVSKLMGTSKIKTLIKIIIPAALPNIFVGLRLGLGAAWMAVVAAELIASNSGLGYRLTEGRELSQPDVVLVGMILIGILGVIMDKSISALQNRVLSWQTGIKS